MAFSKCPLNRLGKGCSTTYLVVNSFTDIKIVWTNWLGETRKWAAGNKFGGWRDKNCSLVLGFLYWRLYPGKHYQPQPEVDHVGVISGYSGGGGNGFSL